MKYRIKAIADLFGLSSEMIRYYEKQGIVRPLEEVAKKYTDEVYVIGGAVKAGNALTAATEGYSVGIRI